MNQYTVEKYLRTKIKSYGGKTNTIFHSDRIPKEGSHCICLPVILIDSVSKRSKNNYPQVVSEEYKYTIKEIKVKKYINDNIDISPDDCFDETSHYEYFGV